ncbi:MAG: naringenin-chalcone synthase [Coxiella sp. RIFCSPHIGHO2_12_FULL_42_15]|nr:MAG: naringenin-chalcone synthase [Coxiella sp. RIFCSPHIGHO2_12_FULL_42_15]
MLKEAAITAIGTATPTYKRSQREIVALLTRVLQLSAAETRLLTSIYKATGIDYRYSVFSDGLREGTENIFFPQDPTASLPTTAARMQIYKNNALPLALQAIAQCFSGQANFSITEVTHLITVSCTGMYAPGIDLDIVRHCGLSSSTQRTCINFMGCYGAFNALKVADSICKAEPNARVLIVAVELCSIHYQKSRHKDHIISNALFSDGAAAVMVQASPEKEKYFSLNHFYCDVLPKTQHEMAWTIADSGFDIILSSYVPDVIERGIEHFAHQLFEKAALQRDEIDFFAIHPGGLKILEACEKALSITKEQNSYSYHVLRNYGNMSSVTILFVLQALWQDIKKSDHGKNIFSCAFGPGLTLESVLLGVVA